MKFDFLLKLNKIKDGIDNINIMCYIKRVARRYLKKHCKLHEIKDETIERRMQQMFNIMMKMLIINT